MPSGELFVSAFNLGLDELDELPLVIEGGARKIEKLNPDGERVPLEFTADGNTVTVREKMSVLIPLVLFIQ